jgi:hypothetical protein
VGKNKPHRSTRRNPARQVLACCSDDGLHHWGVLVQWWGGAGPRFRRQRRAAGGSGIRRPGRVFGVVFDLDESELPVLDRFEDAGKGYDRRDGFPVYIAGSLGPFSVVTYRQSFLHRP